MRPQGTTLTDSTCACTHPPPVCICFCAMASFLNSGFLFLSPLWLPCQVDLFTLDALQMRKVRIKSAKFIHMQLVKSGKLPEGTVFNEAEVDQGGIVDGEEYYGGFTYSSSVAKQYAAQCTPHAYADAAHMEGKGAFSYGTFFEYGIHDQNNSLCSIVKGHTVGTECHDEWLRVFGAAADVPGVDVSGRSVSADMEKSLGNAHDETMKHSSKFYDERHVKKNMIPNLGPKEKGRGSTPARSGRRRWRTWRRSRRRTGQTRRSTSTSSKTRSCTRRTPPEWASAKLPRGPRARCTLP